MIRSPTPAEDEAVGWFVTLQGGAAEEADYVAFRDWLEASPDHPAAFARVEQAWATFDDAAGDQIETNHAESRGPSVVRFRRPGSSGRLAGWIGTGIAAAVAVALIGPEMVRPPTEIYQTAKGERRDVMLADGSHLYLNSASEAEVQLGRHRRDVILKSGEAMFDVVHDQKRPFEVMAGDTRIRDIGTTFNVLRQNNGVTVTVLKGVVDVMAREGAPVQLTQGDQLRLGGNSPQRLRLEDPQTEVAWRDGRLVYRDQPLSVVVADLNRYLPIPVSVDAAPGALRFSGVLQLDREDLMVNRIEALMPVTAASTADTVRLKGRN